ncbi:MAG: class I SAM-dependent methyltransferase [Chloroflexota bacterium]|nr:class I SAM-dependent methyltransferase [Chloroflexota bacterium]
MSDNGLNQQQAEAFGERLVGMLNEGALAHLVSIGHQTGLFDTLSILPPATSGQVAEAAGLNERYVREWLNAMTVGRIVSYNPANQTYRLPPEHAAWLTRAAGADNMAVYMQHVSLLGTVEAPIVDRFRYGGGVPYEAFPRFHEIMAEDSNMNVVSALVEQILPLVPGLVDKLQAGIQVLDVGCGRGRAINVMAQAFPQSHFTGYDISEEAIAFAQAEAAEWGLHNAHFAVKDAAALDAVGRYDLITAFDAIHDQGFPARVLRNIHRALKPDGVFLMQDIAASSHVHHNMDLPTAPFLYTISTMHCMTVSLAQGGVGLGTMWGRETAQRMLAEAGFTDITVQQLPHDIFNDYYISYPG